MHKFSEGCSEESVEFQKLRQLKLPSIFEHSIIFPLIINEQPTC